MTPEVGAVGERFIIDLKNDIVYRIDALEVGAVGGVGVKIHDAGVVVAQTQLLLGAAHTLGLKARDRCDLYLAAADSAARKRKGDLHADPDIRGAADDIADLAADIDLEQVELL